MIENNNSLLETKSRLSYIFEILRGDINASEYHFVMFLLVLQKEDILNGLLEDEKHNLVESIRYKIFKSNSNNTRIYKNIWDLFGPILARLNNVTLIGIISLLQDLDQNIIQKNFAEIFDDLLYKHAKYQGRIGGDYVLPSEISQFLSNLVELPNDAKIYNPFAGLASFGVYGSKKYQYLGQELNLNTWALGQLRLIAYNRDNNCELLQGDSIENWNPRKKYSEKLEDFFRFPPENEKFDLIIANPPFNLRPTHPINGRFGSIRNCEQFVIEKGIEDLAPNGKLIIIVSNGFLFRGGSEQELRRYLIENDLLEMVISFPAGLLFNTGIPFSVIVINKYSKKDRNYVKFIDSKSTIENTSFREKRLKVDALDKIVKAGVASEYVRIVPNEAIAKLDYNLNVPRYFQKEVEGVQLNQFVTPIRQQRNFEDLHGKFVRIKDLKEDKLEYLIDLNSIEKVELPRQVQKISESCLLLASRWRTLKPTFFEFSGESIFITPDTIALKVDESQVNIAYLINELHSDYTTELINSYRLGSTIPTIRRDDLLTIKIKLPILEEQAAKMKGVKEAYIASKQIQLQLEQELLGLENNISREFASMKHTLRQYLSALKSNVLGTKKFISNNEGQPINLNTIYSKNLNQTFEEHLLSLEGTIDSMSKVLLSLDENHDSTDPVNKHDVLKLIIEAQARFGNPTVFEFLETFFDSVSFDSVEPEINIAENDFYKLFSNIISNAINHGFKNSTKHNLIRLCVSYNASANSCEIEVSNNGKPIPKQFTLQHLTTRGEKTTDSNGSGIGGADIKAIVEKYNGYFDLVTDEDSNFPVTYIIGFPQLKQIDDAI